MKLDLKESPTTEPETLDHLLTVLSCHFQMLEDTGDKKFWNKAKKYLKNYIEELIRQKASRIEEIMQEFPEIKKNMPPEEYEWFLLDLKELIKDTFNKK